jgi:RNA polymerase sigma-70 factor (ECF subfamily)
VQNPAAWLTAVTSRICLDHLRSAAHRHEVLDGDLRPERAALEADPADRVTLDESVRAALFVVLDVLAPEERVALILHDVFAMKFSEIAELTGRSPAAARQHASRARRRIAVESRPGDAGAPDAAVVERFMAACTAGRLEDLVAVLQDDAWGIATFVDSPSTVENHGAYDVAGNLLLFLTDVRLVRIDHRIFAFDGLRCVATLLLDVHDGRVRSIEARIGPFGD